MTSIVTRSVYGSSLQSTQWAGLPFNMLPNTTLNEKFGVEAGVAPAANQMPVVGYYCIGNGGHRLQTGAGGIPIIQPIQHEADDAALYNHLPFILRPINSDLSAQDQANYALRTVQTIGGQQYVGYYLKRLVKNATVVEIDLQTINNGQTTSNQFVPTSANLNPVPPDLSNQGTNVLTSQYMVCSAVIPMTLTANECQELLNAATIIYGDPSYAIISEIGLCSGVDKTITLSGGASFNEAIAVQIGAFINAFHAIQFTATGLTGNFNIGTDEVRLSLS